jgi:hypothetical protein
MRMRLSGPSRRIKRRGLHRVGVVLVWPLPICFFQRAGIIQREAEAIKPISVPLGDFIG